MKKILSLVIMLAVIAQVNAKGIEPKSPVGVSVLKKGSVVKLFYRGEGRGTVKVAIYNEKGTVIFKERMQNTEDFMRPYNFSALPAGIYTIELTDEKRTNVQKILHNVPGSKRVAVLKRLSKHDNRYVLFVPNRAPDELTISIYDESDKRIYHSKEVIEGDFARVYNLSQIGGRHVFEIKDKQGRWNSFSK